MTVELNDKTRSALVTGAMSGIGKATAARLAADGIRVITLDRQPGADVCVDLTDERGTTDAVDKIGPIDILVNSAGIVGPNCALWESEAEEWEQTFEVNVFALVRLLRLIVPGMRERGWGRIVNLASIAGKDGNPNLSSYSASKAAVIGLTKSLGKELATSGVLVNAVAPAVIATEMNASTAPEVLTYLTGLIPMRRVGEAHEVAELVAWLASDRVSFSTGAVYDISGGRATY
jgi:2-dehydro-3-deoxy-L-rhamnonate dehydrogenase (NAD+)